MRKLKIFFTLMLSLVMMLSFVGCQSADDKVKEVGGEETTTTTVTTTEKEKEPAVTAPVEKTIVTVWSNNRHDSEYMEKMVAEFNASNELGIEIDYVIQTDNYTNMITMAASSGQAPDIMAISASDGIDLQSFVESNIITPITQLLSDTYKTVNEVDNVQYQGLNVMGEEVYWVPTGMRSGSRLIYNVGLFKDAGVEVPKTLDDLVAAAAAITKKGNGTSYGVIFPGASSPFGRWLESSAQMSGVSAYDYAKGEFNFDNFKPVLEAVRKMFDDGSTFPGTATMKIDPIRAQFAEGTVGIHGNASQEVGVLTEQFPMKSEWGVADLPTYDGTIKGALAITPNFGWMLSSEAKNVEMAMAVIEYFGSEAFLKGYLEGGYSLPISKFMEGKIDKSLTGRLADFSLQEYEDVYPTFPAVTPEGDTYRDALWNACLSDGPDIDTTIANLNKSYKDALDKAVEMGKVKRLVIENYDPMHPSKGTSTYLDK